MLKKQQFVSVMKQNFPLQTENSMLLCVCCDLNVNMQAPKGVFFLRVRLDATNDMACVSYMCVAIF